MIGCRVRLKGRPEVWTVTHLNYCGMERQCHYRLVSPDRLFAYWADWSEIQCWW